MGGEGSRGWEGVCGELGHFGGGGGLNVFSRAEMSTNFIEKMMKNSFGGGGGVQLSMVCLLSHLCRFLP